MSDQPAPITPVESQKKFADAYQKLCQEHGWQIIAIPEWKQSLDNGSFSLVIKFMIAEYREPQP